LTEKEARYKIEDPRVLRCLDFLKFAFFPLVCYDACHSMERKKVSGGIISDYARVNCTLEGASVAKSAFATLFKAILS